MKKLTLTLFALSALLLSCSEERIDTAKCGIPATVRDLTALNVCGSYVFELEDGTRLVPVWDMGYCGTPPLPKEVTEDPLYNFQFIDGTKVIIGFEERKDVSVMCVAAKPAKITCLEIVEEGQDI